MTILKLRHHVPIGGMPRREVVDGTESTMRVSLGFEPAWFHRRCGVDFSKRWHTDPYYRHDTIVKMKQELWRAFPSVTYWNPDNRDDLWSISGCYGVYLVPRLFGGSIQYAPDRWPVLAHTHERSLESLANLDAKALLSGHAIGELLAQLDIIEREAGKINGYIPEWGVLNTAFALRGQDIFLDMMDKPDLAHQFFSLICDVMIGLAQCVQVRQRQSGFYINFLCVANCTVNMVSPKQYYDFLFPYDKRIAESFERFGVHTCNWNVTPYLEALRKLPKMGYLDMGMMSNLKLANGLGDQKIESIPCSAG